MDTVSYKYNIVFDLDNKEQIQNAVRLFTDSTAQSLIPEPGTGTDTEEGISNSLERGKTRQATQISFPLSIPDWREDNIYLEWLSLPMMNSGSLKDSPVSSQYMGHGVIRLFRTSENDNSADGDETKTKGKKSNPEHIKGNDETTKVSPHGSPMVTIPGDDTMVCILFIPTYFTVHDLLHFYIGEKIMNTQVSNFRILRNAQGKLGFNFTILIKFRKPEDATSFRANFNGKRFNKMDPEICHVIPIHQIIFKQSLLDRLNTQSNAPNKLPYLLNDPFTTKETKTDKNNEEIELPTCPVCLERMDSKITGLITIPCQHTFHCQCLDKWESSQCPVCRYSSFRVSRDTLLKRMGGSPTCQVCGTRANLWACLICGHIGCGRYNGKHAIMHYEETSHCFAMDVKTQRVWDYAGDNYVHRLVQNEVDGKLVEVSGTGRAGSRDSLSNGAMAGAGSSAESSRSPLTQETPDKDGKDSDLMSNYLRNKEYHLEYMQVLISQLESQREYYELKLKQQEETKEADKRVTQLQKELKEFQDKVGKLQHQVDEDKLVIRGLQENLDALEAQKQKLLDRQDEIAAEKSDLQEQVRDLMFYLETQEKFKDAPEEEREGTIVLQQKPGQNNKAKRRGKARTPKR